MMWQHASGQELPIYIIYPVLVSLIPFCKFLVASWLNLITHSLLLPITCLVLSHSWSCSVVGYVVQTGHRSVATDWVSLLAYTIVVLDLVRHFRNSLLLVLYLAMHIKGETMEQTKFLIVHQVLLWDVSSFFGNFMEHLYFKLLLVRLCHSDQSHYMQWASCYRIELPYRP
jgi:hypothetical protein